MRHDVIHDMHCECSRCWSAQNRPAVDPGDIDALKKGAIVGLWVSGLLCARHFGPAIIDWTMQ
jgi:hypothetical protein